MTKIYSNCTSWRYEKEPECAYPKTVGQLLKLFTENIEKNIMEIKSNQTSQSSKIESSVREKKQ